MIFVSARAGGSGEGDFYISFRHDKRNDFAWGPPQNITAINSAFDEFGPWAFQNEDADTLTFYFNSNLPGGAGGYDIYESTIGEDWSFSPAVPVPELNSAANDTMPVVRKDGRELFLTSNRTGTIGGADLWVSTRDSTSDPWSTPINLGPDVNSASNDQRAAISWHATTVIFFSNRPGGLGNADLYETTRTKLRGPNK
jgi:WD40-like Beta Propeller Repeat